MKLFGNFNKPVRKKNLKTIVRLHSIQYTTKLVIMTYIFFSLYDKMTHNVVYLFSTPNLGNYQADMTISPLVLNQSKLLKIEYFQ